MYAESGLMYPCIQNLSQEVQQLEQFCDSQKPSCLLIETESIINVGNSSLQQGNRRVDNRCRCQTNVFMQASESMDSITPTSAISDYVLGCEGNLLKAPEPIIEEPIVGRDPMMASISLITCADDVMSAPAFKVCDMEPLQNEQFLSDIFDGCREELLEKTSIETAVSDALDIKLPIVVTNGVPIGENNLLSDLPFTKSCSSGSLSSMELITGATVRPNPLDFLDLDFEAAYEIRRAFSEEGIKALNDGNLSLIRSPLQQSLVICSCNSENRLQKLSRYRNKKSRRNFGKKIKYACRKALADNQPRIHGRFAKTEDSDNSKMQWLKLK